MTYSKIKEEDLKFMFTYRNHYYHYYIQTLKIRLRLGESVEVINLGIFVSADIDRFEAFLKEKVERKHEDFAVN